MTRKRRNHSPEFKAKVALAAATEIRGHTLKSSSISFVKTEWVLAPLMEMKH